MEKNAISSYGCTTGIPIGDGGERALEERFKDSFEYSGEDFLKDSMEEVFMVFAGSGVGVLFVVGVIGREGREAPRSFKRNDGCYSLVAGYIFYTEDYSGGDEWQGEEGFFDFLGEHFVACEADS